MEKYKILMKLFRDMQKNGLVEIRPNCVVVDNKEFERLLLHQHAAILENDNKGYVESSVVIDDIKFVTLRFA